MEMPARGQPGPEDTHQRLCEGISHLHTSFQLSLRLKHCHAIVMKCRSLHIIFCIAPSGPKNNLMFRATRPYLSELADPRLFFMKIPFFFVGVFIFEVSILKKKTESTLP